MREGREKQKTKRKRKKKSLRYGDICCIHSVFPAPQRHTFAIVGDQTTKCWLGRLRLELTPGKERSGVLKVCMRLCYRWTAEGREAKKSGRWKRTRMKLWMEGKDGLSHSKSFLFLGFYKAFVHVSEHSHSHRLMRYFILHWRLWSPVTPQEGWQQWGRPLPAAQKHPEPEPLLGVQGGTEWQHKLFLKSCQCETHWNRQKYCRTGTFKRKEWRLMLKICRAP